MRERTQLENGIKQYRELEQGVEDAVTFIELGEAEDDADSITEGEGMLAKLRTQAAKLELESLLSGEADSNDCFLEIHAGAGGTEAQDWAEMISRMYMRWAESKGYKLELVEESAGDEAALIGDNPSDMEGWDTPGGEVEAEMEAEPYPE